MKEHNLENVIFATLWFEPSLALSLNVVPTDFPILGEGIKVILQAATEKRRPNLYELPPFLQPIVADILDTTPPADPNHLPSLISTLRKDNLKLKLRTHLNRLMANFDESDPYDLLSRLDTAIKEITTETSASDYISETDFVTQLRDAILARQGLEPTLVFGIPELEEIYGIVPEGSLVILSGATASGKTSLAIQAAVESAQVIKGSVVFFSLEMTQHQFTSRYFACRTGFPSTQLFRLDPSLADDQEFQNQLNAVLNNPLPIYLAHAWTLDEIISYTLIAKTRFNAKLFIVDYLQKVIADEKETRQLEVATVAQTLKRLAVQHNVTFLALSQVSNEKEMRTRESRVVEHEADLVIRIRKENGAGECKLEVWKNRMGSTGDVKVTFYANLCRFGDAQKVSGYLPPTLNEPIQDDDDYKYEETEFVF